MARNLSVCAVGLGIEFGDVDDNLDKIGAALTAGPDAAHACWCFSNCPPRQGRVLDRTATRRGGQRDRSGLGRGDDHQPGMASRRGLQPRGTVPLVPAVVGSSGPGPAHRRWPGALPCTDPSPDLDPGRARGGHDHGIGWAALTGTGWDGPIQAQRRSEPGRPGPDRTRGEGLTQTTVCVDSGPDVGERCHPMAPLPPLSAQVTP
jgi:hypothetical protein